MYSVWQTCVVKGAWRNAARVKALVIQERARVMRGMNGVEEDRRFCLVDETGRMLNGKRFAPVATIRAHYEPETERLELRMGDDARVSGTVTVGQPVEVAIFGHQAPGHLVEGPWSDALRDRFGRTLRLVRLDGPGHGQDRAQ